MGFYNVLAGDAPFFKHLADEYAMSDNFHQAIQGGTGANHVALGTGDAIWFSDGNGRAITPPALNIENPDPQPGTNNWYTQDGYSGGTYSELRRPDATGRGLGGRLSEVDLRRRPELRTAALLSAEQLRARLLRRRQRQHRPVRRPAARRCAPSATRCRARHLLGLLRRSLERPAIPNLAG